MTEHLIHCGSELCDSADVKRTHQLWGGDVYYCNFCAYQWLAPAPVTPQQAAWLAARGLACDGTRGHAADIIGDRVPWRKAPPTEAQAAWFAEKRRRMPKTAGEAAEVMWEWKKRKKEQSHVVTRAAAWDAQINKLIQNSQQKGGRQCQRFDT